MSEAVCLVCGDELLLRTQGEQYEWTCSGNCGLAVDTGVSSHESIVRFSAEVMGERGRVDSSLLTEPLDRDYIAGAKVYMPFILHHFIACTWGPCYMSLYNNVVRPHLSSVSVLDYVLRSDVIRDPQNPRGSRRPKMYAELYRYLRRSTQPLIHRYLNEQFGGRFSGTGPR